MKTREEVLDILRNNQADLIRKWPIASLGLFGSVARGDQTSGSDVDLLVEFNSPMGWNFFDLVHDLELLLGVKVDLIPKAGVKQRYWERIAPDVIEVLNV